MKNKILILGILALISVNVSAGWAKYRYTIINGLKYSIENNNVQNYSSYQNNYYDDDSDYDYDYDSDNYDDDSDYDYDYDSDDYDGDSDYDYDYDDSDYDDDDYDYDYDNYYYY